MEFKDRKKLFEKACRDLTKEDLVMYLHGYIEVLDDFVRTIPLAVIPLTISTGKIVAQMESSDAEATRTISAHLKSEFEAFTKAQTEVN